MRLQTLAPTGVTGSVRRVSRRNWLQDLVPSGGRSHLRSVLFVLGRSFLVCSAVAGGLASVVTVMDGKIERRKPPVWAASRAVQPTVRSPSVPRPPFAPRATADSFPLDDDFNVDQAEITWARRIRDDLATAATSSGNPDDILQFGPMRIKRHIVQTILKAAQVTDADPVLLMAIADKESSFSTDIQASTSSASGLFQFISKTWLNVVRDFGAKHGLEKEAHAVEGAEDNPTVADPTKRARILKLRNDPYLSALLAAEMLKRDGARIAENIGRDLTDGETYLAHFLGPDDAQRFMAKVVGEPGFPAAKLLPQPARANKPIFYARRAKGLSVAAVHQKFEAMMGLRSLRYRNVGQAVGVTAYAPP